LFFVCLKYFSGHNKIWGHCPRVWAHAGPKHWLRTYFKTKLTMDCKVQACKLVETSNRLQQCTL